MTDVVPPLVMTSPRRRVVPGPPRITRRPAARRFEARCFEARQPPVACALLCVAAAVGAARAGRAARTTVGSPAAE